MVTLSGDMTGIVYDEVGKPIPKQPLATVDSEGQSVILLPGSEAYVTAWEELMKRSVGKAIGMYPPLDLLGRKRKEESVTPKTGSIVADAANDTPRRVVLVKDHNSEYPDLYLRVHILGPDIDRKGFPAMFARAGCSQAKDIYDADLVVFTGGADVDPAYYGETPVPSYWGNEKRDLDEFGAFLTCYEEGIPMFGVCRGAQLLAVACGGKLVQDVDNHQGDHYIFDVRQKNMVDCVSSVHHQQVIEFPGMEVIATCQRSTTRWFNSHERQVKRDGVLYPSDVEAYFIKECCIFGVQGHPEYADYGPFTQWTLKYLDELVCLNPDIDWVDIGNGEMRRRLSADFRKEREKRTSKSTNKNEILSAIPTKEKN